MSDGRRKDPPFVSVVIPARNEEGYIEAALRSVDIQDYPHDRLECVVVDNGSQDRTGVVAAECARDMPGLRVTTVHEPTPGVGRAKNTGAAMAGGDVLIFMDADSTMDRALARDVAAAWEAGFLCGSIRIVAASSHLIDRGFFALMEVGKVLFGVRGQMLYCDRGLFHSVGEFDSQLHLAEDLDFLRRVKEQLRDIGAAPMPHIRTSAIRTSPRRLRSRPLHLGMFPMFGRWLLAFLGIGRRRVY